MRKKTVIVFLLGLICGLALMGGLMRQDQRLDAEAAPQDTVVSAVPQEAADSQKASAGSSSAAVPAWNKETVYTGGMEVVFGGKIYRAKWWTQG